MVVASINVILLKWLPQHSRFIIRKEGIWITPQQDVYISFIKHFINFCLWFINVIKFFHQNSLILQKNWLYIKRKNLCYQQWQRNNVSWASFVAIITLFFLNNWKWEMLYEEQNIQWKHFINVLKLLTKFTTQHKTIIRIGLIVFLFKRLNVFNLLEATKILITNYTFFVNSFMAELPIM